MLQLNTVPSLPSNAADTSGSVADEFRVPASRRIVPRDPQLGRVLLAAGDISAVVCVLAVIAAAFVQYGDAAAPREWSYYAVTSVLSFVVAQMLASSYRVENLSRRTKFGFIAKPAIFTGLAALFSYGIAVVLDGGSLGAGGSSQIASPQLYVIFGATLVVTLQRLTIYEMLRRWQAAGHLTTNVVIFGADTIGERLIKVLTEEYSDSVRISAIFDDRLDRVPPHLLGIPVGGGIDSLIDMVKRTPSVDKILIALPMNAEHRILGLLTRLRSLVVDVALVPNFVDIRLDQQVARDAHPPILNVIRKPQSGIQSVIKRAFDIIASIMLLAVLSPLFAAVAFAIKWTSPGPILFRQPRLGFNNKEFFVLKFRSMYADFSDLEARQQTTRNDSRITPVGVWLRRLSIDELPQLFNVLAGDMSLVGPRPHALGMQVNNRLCDEIVHEYAVRHRMKPGITGWAQVRGLRGAVEDPEILEARVRHDIYYIDNWSFLFDLRILVMTVVELIRPRNAY
jgi:Undecaprenyl-phosphate glucose phosphotransferase